ncbi:MAG: peptidoglycan editing factor PgeF [Rhodospirillales bacterium]|jgi:polyphenol oxidase|nr:peptidoglycan editing factor PgeF [Rhodospirillales bacterium]
MITASLINSLSGVRHGFFTRRGGVSDGLYNSLNCGFGSDDAADNVAQNRALAMACIDQPAGALVTARQVHSATVVAVSHPWTQEEAPEADGLVTDVRGIALGIVTADCTPVLFADAKAKIIGAAHAGWHGARDGVLEATVEAMAKLGARPERIVAAMGPCIRMGSYEVGPEFKETFMADGAANESFFAPARRDGHFLFDLPTYVYRRLAAIGIKDIQLLQIDNFRSPDLFFSHRRATLAGEPDSGRNLSAIVLGK